MIEDISMMMDNVLVNFEDTGYSFYFISNFEVLKVTPDTVHGAAPYAHNFSQLFCPGNTLEITYSRSVPLNTLGYICY